jgi:HAD superfamily hydrolase (TIGR01509 family)
MDGVARQRRPERDPAESANDRRPIAFSHADAWVFDLDGVITDTASLHERAWTETFGELFAAQTGGTAPAPFTDTDYRRLVDGEARLDGVHHVLASRGLELPEGSPDDGPGLGSCQALANAKDARYLRLLGDEGPRPFEGSVALLRALCDSRVPVAIVSASRHAEAVIEAASLASVVHARVDGVSAAVMELASKPDPATFLEACRRLGVEPGRAIVVEDALAGVEAGRRGDFGLVVGVDRSGQADELRARGADLVVSDLGELHAAGVWRDHGPWHLRFDDPGPDQEGAVETLCTLGNGFLATRGSRPWSRDDGRSYPGTYLAGVYDRARVNVDGRSAELESLVNQPHWSSFSFRASEGEWLGAPGVDVERHRVTLDLRSGILVRRCVVSDAAGHRTALVERRIVSMAEPHMTAQELSCMPLNWTGTLRMRAGIDASIVDDETIEDRLLGPRHLEVSDRGADPDTVWLAVRTLQSHVTVAMASRYRVSGVPRCDGRWITEESAPSMATIEVPVAKGGRATLHKVTTIFTSKDRAVSEPMAAARRALGFAPSFDDIVADQRAAWGALWEQAALSVDVDGVAAPVPGLHLFHLLQVASPHIADLDVGLGARGLHGEGYRGHVFWDTLFVFPVLNLCFPSVSRALVEYRVRRLPEARRAARDADLDGAMFPWQSGSDGREETPEALFNPRSGHWMIDRSRHQRHVGLAIAYEAWQYWQATGDLDFIRSSGAELLFEVTRYFASLARWDGAIERYRVAGVVGPDEFHDGYPWSDAPGITDNAYTNVMTSWLMARAIELQRFLSEEQPVGILERMRITDDELDRWDRISRQLHVPIHQGVMMQFDGYDELEPIDLDAYRSRYGDIGRLDLILEAEGDTVRRYQVCKQADTLMLLYLFSAEELRHLLERMGYGLDAETVPATVAYYSSRATHGSTLSKVVHAWVLARADRHASWRYLMDAFHADLAKERAGTTREGIHLGAMAGTIDILQRCYTGMEVRRGALWFHPALPAELRHLRFGVRFHGVPITVDVNPGRLRLEAGRGPAPVAIMLSGEPMTLRPGQVIECPLPAAPRVPPATSPARRTSPLEEVRDP